MLRAGKKLANRPKAISTSKSSEPKNFDNQQGRVKRTGADV